MAKWPKAPDSSSDPREEEGVGSNPTSDTIFLLHNSYFSSFTIPISLVFRFSSLNNESSNKPKITPPPTSQLFSSSSSGIFLTFTSVFTFIHCHLSLLFQQFTFSSPIVFVRFRLVSCIIREGYYKKKRTTVVNSNVHNPQQSHRWRE